MLEHKRKYDYDSLSKEKKDEYWHVLLYLNKITDLAWIDVIDEDDEFYYIYEWKKDSINQVRKSDIKI